MGSDILGCPHLSRCLTLPQRICWLNKQEKENENFDASVETTAAAAKVTGEVRTSCGVQVRVLTWNLFVTAILMLLMLPSRKVIMNLCLKIIGNGRNL